MVVYYENSKGQKLNLLKAPYRVVDADWYDSDWNESSDGYEKTVDIDVFGNRSEFIKNMERLYSILAVDSEKGVYGRLFVNGSYLRCRIQESKKSSWKGYVYSEVELKFFAPKLEWCQDVTKSFYPQVQEVDADGLDFEFDFEFDFTAEKNDVKQWEIDHVTASDFEIIIYGPCVNPKILINGHPYEVFTSLEKNEYLIIDSYENTITKYFSNGTTLNLFDERGYEYSVFEKIPSGLVTFNWPGDFGYDITLHLKRREALW